MRDLVTKPVDLPRAGSIAACPFCGGSRRVEVEHENTKRVVSCPRCAGSQSYGAGIVTKG